MLPLTQSQAIVTEVYALHVLFVAIAVLFALDAV